MKLSAKPISSPGRTDKFPPPLMRFLKSNAGSRSRRSRSSPLFVRKKNTAIETQEPSSPKVTCMGQVRVRRSTKKSAAKRVGSAAAATNSAPRDGGPTTRCRCWWIQKRPLFCKIKPSSSCRCKPVWPKWGFFRAGSFRKKPTKPREDSGKPELNFCRSKDISEAEHEEEDELGYEERINPKIAFAPNSCSPPKNALLLTRCRSAPYRSSSLAGRFWGSPLRNEEETGEEEQRNEPEKSQTSSSKTDEPRSLGESVSEQGGERVSETEAKLRFFKELEDSLLRYRVASVTKPESVKELKRGENEEEVCEERHHPIMLTRCKSEPARTGHRLDPEVNSFWKKRRLGFDSTLHIISD